MTKAPSLLTAIALAVAPTTISANENNNTSLAGSEWRPVKIGDLTVASDIEVFVQFGNEGRISGNGGCNHFTGTYETNEGTITFGPLASTRMLCAEPQMAVEDGLVIALQNARTYQRDRINLTLIDEFDNILGTFNQTDAD